MDNSVLLSVGETYHLKHGKDRIIYAGMPSENVYSIVQEKERARERTCKRKKDFLIRDLPGIFSIQ